MRQMTFETVYPTMPFAPLVELALKLGALVARKGRQEPAVDAVTAAA